MGVAAKAPSDTASRVRFDLTQVILGIDFSRSTVPTHSSPAVVSTEPAPRLANPHAGGTMKSRALTCITAISLFAALAALMLLGFSPTAQALRGVTTHTGTFADGATYLIEVPTNWNGTLLLFSHGYVGPGEPNPATDVGDPLPRFYLLTRGYALAGSSYATTAWAVHEALSDQIAVLDTFNSLVGQPSRTIAWGNSMGGLCWARAELPSTVLRCTSDVWHLGRKHGLLERVPRLRRCIQDIARSCIGVTGRQHHRSRHESWHRPTSPQRCPSHRPRKSTDSAGSSSGRLTRLERSLLAGTKSNRLCHPRNKPIPIVSAGS